MKFVNNEISEYLLNQLDGNCCLFVPATTWKKLLKKIGASEKQHIGLQYFGIPIIKREHLEYLQNRTEIADRLEMKIKTISEVIK